MERSSKWPEGVALDEPIHLVYLADADGAAIHVRNFISVGRGASISIVEEYIGGDGAAYWSNAVTEVFVDEQGIVDHYKIQREGSAAFHFQTLEAQIEAGAVFRNHAVTIGAKLGRNDIRGKLIGSGGEAVCNGLSLLKERQLFDTHLFMDHAVAAVQQSRALQRHPGRKSAVGFLWSYPGAAGCAADGCDSVEQKPAAVADGQGEYVAAAGNLCGRCEMHTRRQRSASWTKRRSITCRRAESIRRRRIVC